jgi:hypothetical protein
MIAYLNPSDSITAVMAGAAATTNPTYSVVWREANGKQANNPAGSLSGVTAVTLVAAPGSGQREIESLQIYNGDTAVVVVTLAKVVSGTGTTLFSYSLPVGYLLRWTDQGISVVASTTVSGAGAANGATVTASETVAGPLHQTLLTLSATTITVRDVQTGGGVKIYDFPEGRIGILGAVGTLTFTTTSVLASTLHASVTGNWGVGTVTQSTGTLATTQQDIIPTKNFTSSATVNVANTATSQPLAAAAQFDGTATAIDAFLNIGVASGTDIDADATVTCTGTILITWLALGDY